jgi:hypothetical protein
MKNTIEEKDGMKILLRNGKPAQCRMVPPIIVQGQTGISGQQNLTPIYHPCCNACPFFNLNGHELYLGCSQGHYVEIHETK